MVREPSRVERREKVVNEEINKSKDRLASKYRIESQERTTESILGGPIGEKMASVATAKKEKKESGKS